MLAYCRVCLLYHENFFTYTVLGVPKNFQHLIKHREKFYNYLAISDHSTVVTCLTFQFSTLRKEISNLKIKLLF